MSSTAEKEMFDLVHGLISSETRESALLSLSKQREDFADLAPILWHSFGTILALLQEILSVYPLLSPAALTPTASNRVCNALALLQCVASHPETKHHFLEGKSTPHVYFLSSDSSVFVSLLNSVAKTRPFEYLRLTSLGVIGALVKYDDPTVIEFLLSTEIIPLCLRIMETGSDLSKTVATFIVQKILLDDYGLEFICSTEERFRAVTTVLRNMMVAQIEKPDARLLKHVLRCFLRLSENSIAEKALRESGENSLSRVLVDENLLVLENKLAEDNVTKGWLKELIKVIRS